MSWSVQATGTKAGVSKKITEQLDQIAAGYKGNEEAKDIVAVKERALALVEACDLSGSWNAVTVSANGSHCVNEKGILTAHLELSVVRTALELE